MLELLGAKYALRTFLRIKKVKSVHLLVDNTTALSYISNMGGTKSPELTDIAKEVWSFLWSIGTTITLEYIPSKLNTHTDWESRNWRDHSEWKLDPQCFQALCSALGTPDVDLFASRTSHQLPKYVS